MSRPSRLAWMGSSLVFFALPAWLLAYWAGQHWDIRLQARHAQARQALEQALGQVTQWPSTDAYLELVLKNVQDVWRHLGASATEQARFHRMVKRLKRRFSPYLEFVFLDGHGQCMATLSDTAPPRALLRKFWDAYRESRRGDMRSLSISWKMFQAYFGPLLHAKDVEPGSFRLANFHFQRARIWFSEPCAHGMFFIFTHERPEWYYLGLRDQILRYNRRHRSLQLALYHLDPQLASYQVLPPLAEMDTIHTIISDLDRRHLSQATLDHRIWMQRPWGQSGRVLATTPIPDASDVQRERAWVLLGLSMAFGLLTWWSAALTFDQHRRFFSLRLQVVMVFVYIVGIPLLIMAIAATDYLQALRANLERQLGSEVAEGLRTYDRQFPGVLGLLRNTIQKRILISSSRQAEWPAPVVRRLSRFGRHYLTSTIVLFDQAGTITVPEGLVLKDRQALKLFIPVYVAILRSLQTNQPVDIRQDTKTTAGQMVAGLAGVDLTEFYAEALKTVGQLRTIKAGTKAAVQGIFAVRDRTGHPTHLAVLQWHGPNLQRVYHRQALLSLSRRLPGIVPVALSRISVERHEFDPARDIPGRFRWARELRRLYPVFLSAGGMVQQQVLWQGAKRLVVMVPGEQTSDYLLVAVVPLHGVEAEIARVARLFRLASLALLTMALAVSRFIARKVLEPVSLLAIGVQALTEKNYRHRVPILEQNELGLLTATFNRMTESLEEVSLGQQVQEQLFPHGILRLGEYAVHGISRTATGVGGDYFEYLTVQDRFLMVLVGDATGHGIPAALVMAMAKAAVLQTIALPEPSGKAVLETLNRTLFLGLNRKRLMTAAVLWVDTQTHQIEFWNGGHPFPIKRTSDGRMQMIEAGGSPLGLRLKILLSPGRTTLEPGERIFLYTDGPVEALVEQPPRTNFDAFQDFVASRPPLPLELAANDILDHHPHVLSEQPLPDDFTIVILERESSSRPASLSDGP
ncbi:MAG: Serine phosphatase RsbU, regulator of sigma subunit [Candidatus Ozemobacter sibiricus]|uniref:Serine phosphatase RsbU, regulator of sigma subunit n=1 Tax=Candidatus Ozemobacter sibiricus TaxID=2268124 RepID=A0A367ZV75_9BACT|nr:MAG: Serine phosphatase RsbU, regulator of sigma subunit [Candidatus Ozemobacter sibiricus]